MVRILGFILTLIGFLLAAHSYLGWFSLLDYFSKGVTLFVGVILMLIGVILMFVVRGRGPY